MVRKDILGLVLAAVLAAGCGGAQAKAPAASAPKPEKAAKVSDEPKAPVHAGAVAFILARCPFAAEALRSLAEIKQQMGDALDLSVEYVGFVDKDGKPDRSIGDAEVDSALLQICSKRIGGEKSHIEFLKCLYGKDGWRRLPKGWTDCAKAVGIDKYALERCQKSEEAEAELASSYAKSTEIGVVSSPTIFIDTAPYMGGRSKEELLTYLCYVAGAEETRPKACDNAEKPTSVAATLLYDSRCTDQELCDVSEELEILKGIVFGLELARVDYATEEGRQLYERIQTASLQRYLPVIVIDGAIAKEKRAMEILSDYLVPFGKGYMLSPAEGWDPKAEICNNSVDDNADGRADCDDLSCSQTPECRTEIPGRLDLFVMSGCPYAARLLAVVDRFLDRFGRNRSEVDLRIQFIGEVEGGRFVSMHGDEEVAEDLRMVCAQDLYGKGYDFMKYVSCRAENYESLEWESCVPSSMNKNKLKQCANGKRGKDLLKKSFDLARGLGVRGSPTWLLNNKLPMEGRTVEEIKDGFCGQNSRAACGEKLAPEPEDSSLTVDGKCD